LVRVDDDDDDDDVASDGVKVVFSFLFIPVVSVIFVIVVGGFKPPNAASGG
jgi:hypothetical protein